MTTGESALLVRPTRATEGAAPGLGAPREGPAETDSCQLLVQDTTTLVVVEEGLGQGPGKDTTGEWEQTVEEI